MSTNNNTSINTVTFDATPYFRLPKVDVATAIVLAVALLAREPANTTAGGKKEATYRGRTVRDWGERLRSGDEETRERALLVLETLGPDARDAIPSLIALWRVSLSDETGFRVRNILGSIGPEAVP